MGAPEKVEFTLSINEDVTSHDVILQGWAPHSGGNNFQFARCKRATSIFWESATLIDPTRVFYVFCFARYGQPQGFHLKGEKMK